MVGELHHLKVGREWFLDDQGHGMRVTWHLERGFVNLSLWRDDTCRETFHLPLGEVSRVVGVLVAGLEAAASSGLGDDDTSVTEVSSGA